MKLQYLIVAALLVGLSIATSPAAAAAGHDPVVVQQDTLTAVHQDVSMVQDDARIPYQDEEENGEDDDEDEDEDDEDSGDTVVNINLDEVVDEISDLIDVVTNFTDNFQKLLESAFLGIVVRPLLELGRVLSDAYTHTIVSYPDVRQTEVLEVHRMVFHLALLLAVPVVIWLGYRHMAGNADGIRPTVKLLATLVVGGLSPWLLHYPVELSRLVSVAVRPDQVSIMTGLNVSLMMALIILLKVVLLLSLLILYVVRDFFFLFYTAAAPLIFLLTFFKPTRKFMSPLTGLFVGFLIIGPFDLIAYRLVLALIENPGGATPHYIWGLGGLFVMLAIPYVILSSGSSLVLPALLVANNAAGQVGSKIKPPLKRQMNERLPDTPSVRDVRHRAGEYGGRVQNRFQAANHEQPRVRFQSNDRGEFEMQQQTSLRENLSNRFRDEGDGDASKPTVEVEEQWRETHDGIIQEEADLKETNGGDD